MTKQTFIPVILAGLTILTGCNVPASSTPNLFPDPTYLYQTISAGLTETVDAPVAPTPLSTATLDATPALEQTATPVISPSPTQATPALLTDTPTLPCNRASAGKPEIDITVPDGSLVQPGELFSKTWRLLNTGSCSWTRQYALVWFSGEQFGSTLAQSFSGEVPSGQTVDLTVDLVAPESPGTHQTNWKLRAPDGSLFGLGPAGDAPFWARIEVVAVQEPNLAPALTPTLTPIVVVKGVVDLAVNDALDLDSGKLGLGDEDDLALLMHEDNLVLVMPINGARLSVFGTRLPTEVDCSASTMSDDGIELKSISEDTYICYHTNQGLPGAGKITGIKEGSFTLDFTTWMVP